MIEAIDVYREYLAVSRHFNSKTYNYNKYKGKIKVKPETFLKNKQKGLYYKLGVRLKTPEAVKHYFIANFVKKSDFSSYNLVDEACFDCYNSWKHRTKKTTSTFSSDVGYLTTLDLSLSELFISKDGTLPFIIQLFIRDKISIESLVIFDVFFKFIERNSFLEGDVLFEKYSRKIKKYKAFIIIEHDKAKRLIDENLAK